MIAHFIGRFFSELPLGPAVYAYMNGAIFKLFGVAVLLFDLLLAVIFALSINRLAPRNSDFVEGLVIFLSFMLLSTLIAVGLIRLHRWAAVSARWFQRIFSSARVVK